MRENPSESLTKMGNVPTINAIPTRYKGIEFRSRTEARWAVFFDELGIEWQYEPEGYQLLSGWYLPDFWLPEIDAFLEVKPTGHGDDDRWGELSTLTGKRVFVTSGHPNGPFPTEIDPMNVLPSVELDAYFPDGGGDWPYALCQCLKCNRWGCEFDGRSARLPCGCFGHENKAYTGGLTSWAAYIAGNYRFWNPGGAV